MSKIGKLAKMPITWVVIIFMCIIGVIVWTAKSIRGDD